MSDVKTPYQIRQELLEIAKDYVQSIYNTQQQITERQFFLAEEVMKKNEEEGMKLYKEATKNLEAYCGHFPGVDQILAVAKQFQNFVDNK